MVGAKGQNLAFPGARLAKNAFRKSYPFDAVLTVLSIPAVRFLFFQILTSIPASFSHYSCILRESKQHNGGGGGTNKGEGRRETTILGSLRIFPAMIYIASKKLEEKQDGASGVL